jgi:hypothetical protein
MGGVRGSVYGTRSTRQSTMRARFCLAVMGRIPLMEVEPAVLGGTEGDLRRCVSPALEHLVSIIACCVCTTRLLILILFRHPVHLSGLLHPDHT